MLSLRVVRGFGVLILLFCLVSAFVGEAYAVSTLDLMQGDVRKGAVSVKESEGRRYVALDEMLSSLGLAPSAVSGGVVAVFSGKKLEFWSGSNIARASGSVYAMPTPVFPEGGHFWGDANATLHVMSRFLASVSLPSNLRWEGGGGTELPASSPIPSAPSIATRSEEPSSGIPSEGGVKISRIRWGEQAEVYRAVIDLSSQTDVVRNEREDLFELKFPKASSSLSKSTSPWPPLAVDVKRLGDGVLLSFRHNAKKIKTFWLTDPPRYVVDFYGKDEGDPRSIQTSPLPSVEPAGSSSSSSEEPPSASFAGGGYLVVVDAGHGGHDPGASGNGLREKDVTLKAALELISSLKNLGLNVRATRTDDRYLKLGERTQIANSVNADIFISLHCNAIPRGRRASGTELYLMAAPTDKDALNLAISENRELSGEAHSAAEVTATADKKTRLLLKILGDMQQNEKINESTLLAEDIYGKIKGGGFSIRKVRQAPFFVLRGAAMPALLIEMGYVTDAREARLLNDRGYRTKMMDSIAAGILDYLKKHPKEERKTR